MRSAIDNSVERRAIGRATGRRRHPSAGFTLLEILVALSIAAVGLAAVSRTLNSSIGVTEQIESRLLAGWVASNRLAEIRLSRVWRVDSQLRDTVTEAGRTWYVSSQYSRTPDPDLARVDVVVFVDPRYETAAGRLFGYIVRSGGSETASSGNG